jgi:hypothetical protein
MAVRETQLTSASAANEVAIYAIMMYTVIAGTCSSPQTTEINAKSRSKTLMKWVHLGVAQGVALTAVGVYLDKRRWPPLVGAGIAGAMLYGSYIHANASGLKSDKPGTEDTDSSSPADNNDPAQAPAGKGNLSFLGKQEYKDYVRR